MANRAPANPAPPTSQLCDYCHQKPKFANHQYCSKTCATQAATLCKHCNKKPKFQNFDYCGKHCAAQASASGSKPAGKASVNGSGKSINTQSSNVPPQQQSNTGTTSNSIDPVQIAKLVVQHIPQVQALLANAQGQGSTSMQPGAAPQSHTNNPFLNGTAGASSQGSNGTRSAPSSHGSRSTQQKPKISTKSTADDLRCLIPGCKQPVHVDEEGVRVSNYCSLRHREQSVTMGIEEPCIMCLVLPQSDTDYFCSRACREESMRKHRGDDDQSSEWSPVTVDSQD